MATGYLYIYNSLQVYSLYNILPETEVIEVCGQIYPELKARDIFEARDIFDHKLPMTEVEGSIIHVNAPYRGYGTYVISSLYAAVVTSFSILAIFIDAQYSIVTLIFITLELSKLKN